MLTKRQNMIETMRGGNPDRFVNGHEALAIVRNSSPYMKEFPRPRRGEEPRVNGWGVLIQFPEGVPGAFPVHDEEHILLKDIEHWRDIVKAPELNYTEEDWADAAAEAAAIDRNEYFVTFMVAPGIFEQCHELMSMVGALTAFAEYPDEMHELIDYITEFELKCSNSQTHSSTPARTISSRASIRAETTLSGIRASVVISPAGTSSAKKESS